MNRILKALLAGVTAAGACLLSGCSYGNSNQYFALPQPAGEYVQLQQLIDQEIADGCEYAAPTQGRYRQSVLLYDTDADGTNEAFVFLRDKKQQAQVMIFDLAEDGYVPLVTLTREASAVSSIEFGDLDMDGAEELAVSWQVAPDLNYLSIYRTVGAVGESLLDTDCCQFGIFDMTGSGTDELIVIRNTGTAYMADMYTFRQGGEPQATTAALSGGIESLKRVRFTPLSDGTPAVLVEAGLSSGDLATDLLISRDGSLTNLTMNRATGVSGVRRSYSLVYSQDMNGDGILDIPDPQRLYSDGGEVFWSIAWYDYDATGRTTQIMTTYHCYSDGWYLVLPDKWTAGLTVQHSEDVAGEHSVSLCRLETNGKVTELVTIYSLTGENRYERARLDGRFTLAENDSTVYAASLPQGSVSRQDIQSNFNIIYTEWSSGSV